MSAIVSGQHSLFADVEPKRPTLRAYQERGVAEILACLQRRADPLYALPTAGGKMIFARHVTESE